MGAICLSLAEVGAEKPKIADVISIVVYFFPATGFFVVLGCLLGLVLAAGAAFLSTDFFAEVGVAFGRATSGP